MGRAAEPPGKASRAVGKPPHRDSPEARRAVHGVPFWDADRRRFSEPPAAVGSGARSGAAVAGELVGDLQAEMGKRTTEHLPLSVPKAGTPPAGRRLVGRAAGQTGAEEIAQGQQDLREVVLF